MNACILTEAGKSAGFGHLTRCIALRQALTEYPNDVSLVIAGAETKELAPFGVNDNFRTHNWHQDFDFLDNILSETDLCIIDSYFCKEKTYRYIAERSRLILCLDDDNRLPYPPGFVMNGSIGADMLDYPASDDITYLLGTSYQPMRNEFWNTAPITVRKELKNLLVFFGGGDSTELMPRVIGILRQKFPGLRLHILSDEPGIVEEDSTRLYARLSASDMIRLFNEADLAITAGGQTLYELARVGLPSIVIKVVENQNTNILGWEKTEFIKYIGDLCTFNADSLCSAIEGAMPEDVRHRMHEAGLLKVDGMGAKRAVDTILKKFQ